MKSVTWRQVQDGLATLKGAPEVGEQIRSDYLRRSQEIRSNDGFTEPFKQQQVAALSASMMEQWERLQREVADAKEAVFGFPGPSPDRGSVQERLLNEQQESRAWARAERLLRSGVSPNDLVRDAEDRGDVVMLWALHGELPAWVEATASGTMQERRTASLDVSQLVDLALARSLPAGQEREALRARVRGEALAPLAQLEVDFTRSVLSTDGRGMSDLDHALTREFLQREADRVTAKLEDRGDDVSHHLATQVDREMRRTGGRRIEV